MSLMVNLSSPEALYWEPLKISCTGALPGEHVSITLKLTDGAGVEWNSEACFVADHKGEVDPETAPSISGSYCGLDEDGLWWSLMPDGFSDGMAFQKQAEETIHKMGAPLIDPKGKHGYTIAVRTLRSEQTVTQTVTRSWLTDQLFSPLDENGLKGHIIRQSPNKPKLGAVLIVTGSDGGTDLGAACALASAGFDVVALAHFAFEGRPNTLARIDLEYFRDAMLWMRKELGYQRVAVHGRSRGADLSLVLGCEFPELVCGVTSLNGYSHVIAGWDETGSGWVVPPYLLAGAPYPFLKLAPPEEEEKYVDYTEKGMVWAQMPESGLSQVDEWETAIKVENSECPILLISGGDDALWYTTRASDRVINRLRALGYGFPYRHLTFEYLGHRIPWPHQITSLCEGAQHPLVDVYIRSGGSPRSTAETTRPIWKALLEHYENCFALERDR